jgi:(heptosyl)LPS beta-1,4-glucosyltransferase
VKLTVTVITHNEAHNIAAALESVAWADEIIVVDSHSTDETVSIARRHATRVERRDWPGYGAQKNRAADLASNDWILSIDADERVSPDLAYEIRALMQAGPACAGYRMPRVTWYLGRWLRSTDWYPDYQLRLYDRRAGRWSDHRVHESVELRATPGRLRHELQHYAYRNVSHHLSTMDRYTTLAAEEWMARGKRTTVIAPVVHAPMAFVRNYILRGGIRDGSAGFLVSALNSYYVFLKYVKLWELQRSVRAGAGAHAPEVTKQRAAESPSPRAAEPRTPSPEPPR